MVSTPEKILNSAEELFADHGIAAVSLRRVIRHAGVNIAAVHYHFGSKEELIRAVFKRRIATVNEQRLESLSRLKRTHGNQPVPVRELLQAFLTPALQLGQDETSGGKNFFRIAARAHSDPDPVVKAAFHAELREVVEVYLGELSRSVPETSREVLALRLMFSAGAMVQAALQPYKNFFEEPSGVDALTDEQVVDHVIDFCVGGFLAGFPDRGNSE